MRLFIAIDSDPALHPVLAQVINDLRSSGADAKWTTPPQWHVTLKFFGEVGAQAVPEIRDAVERLAASSPPALLRLNGVGVFGGLNPRVVFAKIEDPTGTLERLAGAVDRGMRPLGFHSDNHVFNPHLTLARLRSRRNAPALLDEVRKEAANRRGEWVARELVLYRSVLKPAGAEYEALHRSPLRLAGGGDHAKPQLNEARSDSR
ncbi:MAG: hypothetical protein FD180_2059 [Planctomycetota bacterium]|nr:MAG: hypothetical protein FD180_2059 [Planctomycetota bacterium]